MKKAKVIINEQHTMFPQQVELLDSKYEEWETLLVPATGWTLEEQKEQAKILSDLKEDKVFASPIPFLLMTLSDWRGANSEMGPGRPVIFYGNVLLFHNDKREKKELPGGKVINAVAQDGWQLVTT